MDKKDGEFLKRIQATFRTEAKEHLRIFSAGLIEMEKSGTKKRIPEIIENMFREIHSLKGAARSIDQREIESVCYPVESLFSALKRDLIPLSPALFDILYKAVESLRKLITSGDSVTSSQERQIRKELILRLKEASEGVYTAKDSDESKFIEEPRIDKTDLKSGQRTETKLGASVSSPPLTMEVVRIPISKLDSLLLQAEEMIQTKKTLDQRITELKEISASVDEWKSDLSGRRAQRATMTVAIRNEWFDITETNLNRLENNLKELMHSMVRDQYSLNRMVNDHLEEMKHVLMLPVSSLVETFPVMVREISREQGKEIEFIIRGAELEIDKRILEDFKDPLIHLIRNSIDHGIGKPEDRISLGKSPHGTIILSFTARESGMVEIILSDDGRGINKELVLKSAVRSGIVTREAAGNLNPDYILPLIYHSGVTTSSIITDISGRGLGLSIVREKVEKLNGRITVETESDKGTTFHILIPMTLATFRGLLVKIKEFLFVLPTMNVEKVLKVGSGDIKTVENHETILVDDHILSVADLAGVLGLPEHKHNGYGKNEQEGGSDEVRLVVLVSGEKRIAFKVDEMLDEQQVLVKGLGKLLKRVRNISGATILGTGNVVPVIHVADLMKSALMSSEKIKSEISGDVTVEKIKRILVAEDSVTARTLLKNILETAGYQVTTAIDGSDAFTRARTGEFDLIVSDVDMPRMNGFELTVRIRNDKKLAEIPVILVTALESREDREHGIEAGADAYIVKSSFDQTNLLGIIKRLI